MGKADLHAHTCHDSWGDGNATVAEFFEYVEHQTDLDIVAITDHDSTDAARAGLALHRDGHYRFAFLPGVEVTNQAGHLLCYFPDGHITDIPSLRPFWSTVRFAQQRGAVCIAAHPVYPPWLSATIARGLRHGHRLDGIETVNAMISPSAQTKLDALARSFDGTVAMVGNSDAHDLESLQAAYTEFPGQSVGDFLSALKARQTRSIAVRRPAMDPGARSFTTRRSMTRPGWVRNLWRELRPPRGVAK
jgi:predicted metal-dependent phosphoesterase TrpH